jgi:hypothetical protein
VRGEGAVVDVEPRRLVLADDEGTDRDAVRPPRLRHRREQRPPHLPQHPLAAEAERVREGGGPVVRAVRPQPQPAGRSHVGAQLLDQPATVPAAAMLGSDGELRARPLDLVGGVEVGVADEDVAVVQQQVARHDVTAVPQVEHHMLGQRPHAVGGGHVVDETQHRLHLVGGQPLPAVEPRAAVTHERDPSDACGRAGCAAWLRWS